MNVQSQAAVTVRRRDGSDDPFIARLARSAFGEYSNDAAEQTLGSARSRAAVTLVAEIDDVPIGFAVVQFSGQASFLQAIAVQRTHRGIGIGRRLMSAAERLSVEHGARALRLCTAESNLEALDLFLKRGFTIERRIARGYPRGQTICVLVKRLADRPSGA